MLTLLRQAFPTASAADLSARLLYTANDSFFLNSTVSKLSIATYTNANGTVTQTVRVLRQPRPKLAASSFQTADVRWTFAGFAGAAVQSQGSQTLLAGNVGSSSGGTPVDGRAGF